jgi:uroporphyrin-3 C-methyltransferase
MNTTLIICKPQLPEQFLIQRASLAAQLPVEPGLQVLPLPLFDLVPNSEVIQRVFEWVKSPALRPHQLLVFVSPSALEMVLHNMGAWPESLYCAVMGRQSAELARKLGVPDACILAPMGQSDEETEDSDGLAQVISKRFEVASCDVLICKGPRGRTEFMTALQVQGHQVSSLECYDRCEIRLPQETIEHVCNIQGQVVLWLTSSETVLALDQQFKAYAAGPYQDFQHRVTVLTTHPRIRNKCSELGFSSVIEIPTGIQSVNQWLLANKTTMPSTQAASAAPPEHKSSPMPVPNAPISGAMPSGLLPKLAFALSLLSLILSVMIGLSGRGQVEKTRIAFGERLQTETTRVDLLKEQLAEASDLSKDLKTRFDLLEEAQKEEVNQRQSLQELYNNLLSGRAEVSLSEVEQLVSIAKRQLYLLGNLHGASVALEQAIDVLGKVEKPSLIGLRKAMAADLAEIKALPNIDLMKLAVDLDFLINTVESLPMLSGVAGTPLEQSNQKVPDETASGNTQDPAQAGAVEKSKLPAALSFSKVWEHVKAFFKTTWIDVKSLVQVTEVNTSDVLLLSARQEVDVRNALRLSLLNARMTLLSRQTELLQADLSRSSKLLTMYFDSNHAQVAQAQQLLKSIESAQVDLVLPELKATTSALRLAQASQEKAGAKP